MNTHDNEIKLLSRRVSFLSVTAPSSYRCRNESCRDVITDAYEDVNTIEMFIESYNKLHKNYELLCYKTDEPSK